MLVAWGSRSGRYSARWGALAWIGALACGVDERHVSSNPACPLAEDCAAGAAGASGGASGGASASSLGGTGGADGVGLPGSNGGAGGSGGGGPTGGSGPAGGANAAGAAGSGTEGGSAGTAAVGSTCSSAQLLSNGGFEAGVEPWVPATTGQDPLIYDTTEGTYEGVAPHGGQSLAWLGGVASETNRLSQTVNLPAGVILLTLGGALRVQIFEEHPIVDFLRVNLAAAGQTIQVAELDNGDASEDWQDILLPIDVAAYAGQAVTIDIESQIGVGPGTNFYLDDLTLTPECAP